VVLQLPLINAVAHNGIGALLLAAMLWLSYRCMAGRS
jgi:heme A synthase